MVTHQLCSTTLLFRPASTTAHSFPATSTPPAPHITIPTVWVMRNSALVDAPITMPDTMGWCFFSTHPSKGSQQYFDSGTSHWKKSNEGRMSASIEQNGYVISTTTSSFTLHQHGTWFTTANRRGTGDSLFDFARRQWLGSLHTLACSPVGYSNTWSSLAVVCWRRKPKGKLPPDGRRSWERKGRAADSEDVSDTAKNQRTQKLEVGRC